jgi:hypothetical protein
VAGRVGVATLVTKAVSADRGSTNDLTKHEIETLEMLAGRREEERGAVMSMCLDYLRGRGYCTPGPNHTITSAGLAVLAEWDAGGIADAS